MEIYLLKMGEVHGIFSVALFISVESVFPW